MTTTDPIKESTARAAHRQLLEEGYCKFSAVLPESLLQRLRDVTGRLLHQRAAERAAQLSTGSMIPTTSDPIFAELVAFPGTLAILKALGYARPTFTDGYVISKPPFGPPLFWHYDWFAWDTPRAFEPEPMQLFVMYYLRKTTRANGCLRVIPGTHVRENPLHLLLAAPHSQELSQAKKMEGNPAFSERSDEVDVGVEAGDLLIGDARLLHAAHANATDEERTLITLWYQPNYAELPEDVQAQMTAKAQAIPADWPETARALLRPFLPAYSGAVLPAERRLRPNNAAMQGLAELTNCP